MVIVNTPIVTSVRSTAFLQTMMRAVGEAYYPGAAPDKPEGGL